MGTQELEAKTRGSYAQLLKTHILPTLGALRLRDLEWRHVKTLLRAKRAERLPRKSGNPLLAPIKVGYSKNTVRLIKAALSTVLSDAVDDGYLKTNPAFGAGRKRGKHAEALTQAERLQKVRPMSWQDRDALLAASVSQRRYHALFSVLTKAGLRPGEAFALQPGDLDLKARTLRVERAVTLGGRVKDTKTHDARTVDLTPDLAQTLRRWVVALKEESLAAGRGEPVWLLPKADGTLMDKDHAAAVFRKLLKLGKVPDYRMYYCRHTYASLLLATGAPITYVSQQLGHSSPSTTLKFYARWIPSEPAVG
jgi:integrase